MLAAIDARAGIWSRFPEVPAAVGGVVGRPRLHAHEDPFMWFTGNARRAERPLLGDRAEERALRVDAPAEPLVTALRLVPHHVVAALGAGTQIDPTLELLAFRELHVSLS